MRADAIVVLGCRIGPGGRAAGPALRRVDRAARAWRDGVAPVVIASGGRRWRGVSEAAAMAKALVERGVPRGAIRRECCSLSTRENARYTARMLRRRGGACAAIVTCSWHMARAQAAFEAAGVRPIALPAAPPRAPAAFEGLRVVRERVRWTIDVLVAAARSGRG